jgi:Zn finger protein HypA/HybF involved in hydrogenase expression
VSPADAAAETQADEPKLEGYAKYRHLKANVRRRRAGYLWIILLVLVVVALAFVDVMFIGEASDTDSLVFIEYAVYGLLAILFLWGIFMLFSGKRPVEEEAVVPKDMERTLLQCPECKSTFQFGESHFVDNKRTAFSCPVCGAFGKLPDPYQEPVKVLRPEGDFKELQYHCTNCNEDIAVGTFGETPLHLVRFRACPHCGQKGFIERIQAVPPPSSGEWSQA